VEITNGIHMPTWQDQDMAINQHDQASLWQAHFRKKQELAAFVKTRTGYDYDPNRLVICWARRFAGYKRPEALFEDIVRLEAILTNPKYPVQLLMAGRAHATDTAAKEILKQIIEYMQDELAGNALFIPNYDLAAARMLTRGSDVWLNTPMPGQEASGTSGMKALANGVLAMTVEDGWSAEVDWHETGWSLDGRHLADSVYFRLEHDVVPEFYHRNNQGIPEVWVEKMQRSIALAPSFATKRMLQEYQDLLYA
jgi:starch phosphorylase